MPSPKFKFIETKIILLVLTVEVLNTINPSFEIGILDQRVKRYSGEILIGIRDQIRGVIDRGMLVVVRKMGEKVSIWCYRRLEHGFQLLEIGDKDVRWG